MAAEATKTKVFVLEEDDEFEEFEIESALDLRVGTPLCARGTPLLRRCRSLARALSLSMRERSVCCWSAPYLRHDSAPGDRFALLRHAHFSRCARSSLRRHPRPPPNRTTTYFALAQTGVTRKSQTMMPFCGRTTGMTMTSTRTSATSSARSSPSQRLQSERLNVRVYRQVKKCAPASSYHTTAPQLQSSSSMLTNLWRMRMNRTGVAALCQPCLMLSSPPWWA